MYGERTALVEDAVLTLGHVPLVEEISAAWIGERARGTFATGIQFTIESGTRLWLVPCEHNCGVQGSGVFNASAKVRWMAPDPSDVTFEDGSGRGTYTDYTDRFAYLVIRPDSTGTVTISDRPFTPDGTHPEADSESA